MKVLSLLRSGLVALSASVYFLCAFAIGCVAAGAAIVHQAALAAGFPVAPLALGVNSPGALSGAIIIQRALDLTFQRYPMLGLFAKGFKDYDGRVAQAKLNQTVTSRIQTPSSVTTFGTSASDYGVTDVSGKLRNFKQIYHAFSPGEVNATDRNLIDEAAIPMATGLAIAITASVTKQVSRAKFNTTSNGQAGVITVASDWGYTNTTNALRTALLKRGVPQGQQQYLLANADVEGSLRTDPLIVAALNNPQNMLAIQRGELPEITSGLRFGSYPGLTGADGNLVGFAGTPDALLYLARAPMTPDEVFSEAAARAPFVYGIVTEPSTGFSVMAQQWIGTDLKVHTRLAWLDGLEIGNANNLVRLVSGNAEGTSGTITALTAINTGYRYVNSAGAITAPTIAFSGGGGSGAAATCTVDTEGAISGFTISNAGTGYTSAPTVTITPASSGSYEGEASVIATVGGLA
jgi:hypothetical protein